MPNDSSELSQIAFKYKSDKCPQLGRYSYTEYYYTLLSSKRQSIKKVLEIGVGNGASLRMWRDFFPHAQIYGADISPELMLKEDRIQTFVCDKDKMEDLEKLIEKIGPDIDLVIDNSSHLPNPQPFTCLYLMPLLNKNVIYVIEAVSDLDIRNSLGRYDHHIPNIGNKIRRPDNTLVVIGYKKMAKTSIIIPSRNESYECQPGITVLQRTVQDIYEKARGNFEVIVGFDGPPYQEFPNYPNLITVKLPATVGLKIMLNMLASMASGKYIFKTDAHCMFGEGFNEILQSDMEDNWVVMPRFYVLNAESWKWQDERHYDYFYLHCPFTDRFGFRFKAGGHWPERTTERDSKSEFDIDETPQIHGSSWFISKDYYFNCLGGFPAIDPMGHAQEPPYLGLKTWLGPWGGQVMVNKKTWYAHMHKGEQRPNGYTYTSRQTRHSYDIAAKYWMGNKWAERAHDIDWFIKKFMPMPTWPKNWEELYKKWSESQ